MKGPDKEVYKGRKESRSGKTDQSMEAVKNGKKLHGRPDIKEKEERSKNLIISVVTRDGDVKTGGIYCKRRESENGRKRNQTVGGKKEKTRRNSPWAEEWSH